MTEKYKPWSKKKIEKNLDLLETNLKRNGFDTELIQGAKAAFFNMWLKTDKPLLNEK